jgi:hypothetical protein
MIDDQIIKHAAEEVLEELDLGTWRLEVEPAAAAPHGDVRQIRFFNEQGKDKTTVIDFEDADGKVIYYIEDIKEKIRKELETLVETDE